MRAEAQTGAPELVVRIRPADAARHGLRQGQILDAIHAAYQGAEVGQVFDRNRIIDLTVILEPKSRSHAETVANLWLSVMNMAGVTIDKYGESTGRLEL